MYEHKDINVRYYYWALIENKVAYPGVNLYDKHGNEYRFGRQEQRRQWTSVRETNRWPLAFRKILGAELEKIHAEVLAEIENFKKPTFKI